MAIPPSDKTGVASKQMANINALTEIQQENAFKNGNTEKTRSERSYLKSQAG